MEIDDVIEFFTTIFELIFDIVMAVILTANDSPILISILSLILIVCLTIIIL